MITLSSQVEFKTSMLHSGLCDYSDTSILVKFLKGTVILPNTAFTPAAANNTNKKVIFKNCASFSHWMSETNNSQVDNAKDIDVVIPVYNKL